MSIQMQTTESGKMKVNFKFWIKLSFAIAFAILLSGALKAALYGFMIFLSFIFGGSPGIGV